MKRPRHPTPLYLKSLKLNQVTGLYEMEELGITYSLPFELLEPIKHFFRHNKKAWLYQWYEQLPREERSMVVRSGNVPENNDTGFFPDE